MIKKNIHVLIAGPRLSNDKIKFRRRRLAEYLSKKKETKKVFWIYFKPDNLFSFGKIRFIDKEKNDTIQQVEISDFKYVIANSRHLQKRLTTKIKVLLSDYENCEHYLWFTLPRFSRLANLKWAKIIYDCSDFWGGQYSMVSFTKYFRAKSVLKSEKQITTNSDICFASSEFLYQYMLQFSSNVHLIENGVDYVHFSQCKETANELKKLNGPILGFTGDMLPLKISFDLIFYIATKEPKWNIILVGPAENPMLTKTKFYELIRLPNVHYFNFVEFEMVPSYIMGFDVALLPYKNADFNNGVFPLKFFEYLAVGKVIVGTGLPATKKYVEDGVYHYADTPQDFLTKCRLAIKLNNNNIIKRKEMALKADWTKKLSNLYVLVFNLKEESNETKI